MRARIGTLFIGFVVAALSCVRPKTETPRALPGPNMLVPLPALVEARSGEPFIVTRGTTIRLGDDSHEAIDVAMLLQEYVRQATGFEPRFIGPRGPVPSRGVITLLLEPNVVGGDEAYDLTIATDRITIRAPSPAGLFYAAQTLRQLLPPSPVHEAIVDPTHIADAPRYAWRGAMLDVARHFFGVEDVKRYVDVLALHKMNRLHLHLADDQGWRIEIKSWPDLTLRGGTTEVGRAAGSVLAYTQAQYVDIVAYAAKRFVTVVPEIDMPGHTNAALSSYPELSCNGIAPKQYTGTEVGFSALCVENETTYRFIDDVVREIAGLTAGPYFHAGGDEVKLLTADQYKRFIERVQSIVQAHKKELIGWDEIAAAALSPTTIVQHWRPHAKRDLLAGAPNLVLSPANRVYLDMKYDKQTPLGLEWAGLLPIQRTYDWDPDATVPNARPGSVLGVEAPLWSETTLTMRDVEYLALPRLAAIAEVAWSAQGLRQWETFKLRLGAQAPRWIVMGLNFYRAPEIPWRFTTPP